MSFETYIETTAREKMKYVRKYPILGHFLYEVMNEMHHSTKSHQKRPIRVHVKLAREN
jgi:hypothetical protein